MDLSQKEYSDKGNLSVIKLITEQYNCILDVGCGNGSLARALQGHEKTFDGITLSSVEAEKARNIMRSVYIHNLEDGLPGEIMDVKYDLIICSHVLEHICWPNKLLSDIRLLSQKSHCPVIIALPNIMHYKSRLSLLMGNFNYTNYGTMDESHFKWYTFRSAQNLFLKNNFSIQKAWVDGMLPAYTITRYLPSPVHKLIKNMLFKISKGFFGDQLLYIII